MAVAPMRVIYHTVLLPVLGYFPMDTEPTQEARRQSVLFPMQMKH